MGLETIIEYTVSEFRGNFPDVPVAPGVDMDALRAHDTDALFVTLPVIPKVGMTSRNGLLYDEALAASIVAQINDKRPDGIWGHLREEERSTAFPEPAAVWLGAKREGDTVWAKALITGSAKERIRRLKATGGQIATSIYGKGDFEQVKPGVRRLKSFDLESLDFAPPARAALRNGSTPILTAELEQENPEMNKEQLIAELTTGDIPAALRDQIIAEAQAAGNQQRTIAELRQQVTDRDALVAELQTTVAEYQRQRFDADLDTRIAELTAWNVTGDANVTKVAAFRRTLKSRIVAELGEDRDADKVAETVTAMWTDLQPLAETLRDALAGPPAAVGAKPAGRQAWKDELVSKAGELRAQYGI